MKNGYLVLSLVISTLILSSCGNNTKSSNESTDNSQQTDFTTTAISTTTSDEVATTTLTTSEVTQDVHEDTFITNVKKNLDYAKENKAIILFDSAYEIFITEENVPHSIYEIEGAKDVAIEFRSFSKTAGFTGVRCAYAVVPKTVFGYTKDGEKVSLNKLWNRRTTTKFNGVSYVVQRAAEATYSEEGRKQIQENIKAMS